MKTAMPTVGLNLRVTTDSRQGGRKYMEDVIHVKFHKGKDGKEIEFAYFAVFDGHGGVEAASFAKEHLLEQITKNKLFYSDKDTEVMKSITDAFLSTHSMMWKVIGTWPKTVSGLPSTAGTTASVVIIRNSKMYVAHVGDSSVVLAAKDRSNNQIRGHLITEDHKPDSPEEKKRIESNGGSVIAKAGVQRVVWNRPKPQHKGPIRRSTAIDTIPFLAIARSLGDLWSYNSERDVFVVSPEPDVAVYNLDHTQHTCLILASDGLWNMLKPQDAVDIVLKMEEEQEESGMTQKPAVALVRTALARWASHNIRADNTSVICVMLDPPGASRTQMRNMSSVSSGSTVRISESDDSMSESEESDSGESMTVTDNSAECRNDDQNSGILITPFTPLAECKPTDNRFNHCKPIFRPSPRRPIYRGKPTTPRSAPAKFHTASFRHHTWAMSRLRKSPFPNSSPYMCNSDSVPKPAPGSSKSQGLFDSLMNDIDPRFMDPTSNPVLAKTKSSPVKMVTENLEMATKKTPTKGSMSPARSQSPRLVGGNLTNNHNSPHETRSQSPGRVRPLSPRGSTAQMTSPKEATSAKSPVKINTAMKQGSPSAGLVSPIWPSNLEEMGMDMCLEVEIAADLINSDKFTIETTTEEDASENIENPCVNHRTPEKRCNLKRKATTPITPPQPQIKRTKTPSPARRVSSPVAGSQMALRTRTPRKSH